MLDVYESNKGQLGFLPTSVFDRFVNRNEILIAHEAGDVCGYLLFRRSSSDRTIRVTHLCTAAEHRGQGVATALLQDLKQRYAHFIRVTARCRKDFPSWKFWKQRSGFSEGRELAGRKQSGSRLTEFFWEPNELPLFRGAELPKVVLDANIFFDLYDRDRSRHRESSGLLEDWLSTELGLCVTNELLEDTRRSSDPTSIERVHGHLEGWSVLDATAEDLEQPSATVESILGTPGTPQDISDHRHLAIAIANGAVAFVTRDQKLIDHSEAFFDAVGVTIARPADIINHFDVLQDNDKYQFRELERTGLRIQRFSNNREVNLALFRSNSAESTRPLKAMWHDAVANPHCNDVMTIVDAEGAVVAIAIADRSTPGIVNVTHLRIRLPDVNKRFGKTLIRFMAAQTRQLFGETSTLIISDSTSYLDEVFSELGFLGVPRRWMKISISKVLAPDEFAKELDQLVHLGILGDSECKHLKEELEMGLTRQSARQLLKIEDLFSPLKLDVPFIRNYIVPIQPRWAKDLFDPALAASELWGTPVEKVLNPHSVYYKASGGFAGDADCCRLIWYVSSDASFPGSKHMRSSSIMKNRVCDYPKELHRRFRRLGIYEFWHVRDTPKQVGGRCEAIEFCATEIWENPIPYRIAIEYLGSREIANNNFVTAQEIPHGVFLDFYRYAFASRFTDASTLDQT